eukprot:c13180_g5_i1.p1 GENE.c13180_g5_i1~~c13180_g5_i1.p1  ORF type:complete len:176 (+),score=34.67 c13180_g5_i1:313-840(+)
MQGLRQDTLLSDGQLGKMFVDVGISATPASVMALIVWPTAQEVEEALVAEKRQQPQEPDLFWETHRSEPHHRDSDSIRAFRKLCGDKVVHTTLSLNRTAASLPSCAPLLVLSSGPPIHEPSTSQPSSLSVGLAMKVHLDALTRRPYVEATSSEPRNAITSFALSLVPTSKKMLSR